MRTNSGGVPKETPPSQGGILVIRRAVLIVASGLPESTVLCVDHSHVGSILPLFCCSSFLSVANSVWKGPTAGKSCRTRSENWLIVLISGASAVTSLRVAHSPSSSTWRPPVGLFDTAFHDYRDNTACRR